MKFEAFEAMYAMLWDCIYAIMGIFGYEVVDGKIVKVEA